MSAPHAYCDQVLSMRAHRLIRTDAAALVGVVALAMVAGLVVVARVDGVGPFARPELRTLTTLPLPVYPLAGVGVLAIVLMRNHWWTGLALFFGWLPFEDLVRKFAANDLRVYFVKDVLLAIAVIGMIPKLHGCWRQPLGGAWTATITIFVFAAVMAIPGAAVDPALPLIGMHTRFLYALLLPIGVYLAQSRDRLESALLWLTILTAAICALGIVQAIIGPEFLNPSASSLSHLTVIKVVGDESIARPSGTFTDVSRFASLTIVTVVLGLTSLRLASTRSRRNLSLVAIAVAIGAAFASGSRTSLLVSVPLAAIAVLFPVGESGLGRRVSVIAAIAMVAITPAFVGGAAGESTARTAAFYAATINPRSQDSDLIERTRGYGEAALRGIQKGGAVGGGTGTEALGAQYLGGRFEGSGTESGWGSVGVEWGFVGVSLWVYWTVAWLRRLLVAGRARNSLTNSAVAPIVTGYVFAHLVVMFSLGIGFFENYIANVFFWLLSGIVFGLATSKSTDAESADLHRSQEHEASPLKEAFT